MNELKAEVEGLYREIELGRIMGECVNDLVRSVNDFENKQQGAEFMFKNIVLPRLQQCQDELKEKKNGNRLGSDQERSSEESAD